MEPRTPKIGDVVVYRDVDGANCEACVTHVWSDTCVNLTDSGGRERQSVNREGAPGQRGTWRA